MKVSTEKFRSTDISGNYADMAKAFGGHGSGGRNEDSSRIKRAIRATESGKPALLEILTSQEVDCSIFKWA